MISNYTDIISLVQAKNYLRVDSDLTEDDAFITSCINAAFGWIEKYTNHILKDQTKDYFASPSNTYCGSNVLFVYDYPVVWDEEATFTKTTYSLYTKVLTSEDSITLDLGYDAVDLIPEALIQAAYSIIQVWYYNSEKTIQSTLIPDSVKFALDPYRRFL